MPPSSYSPQPHTPAAQTVAFALNRALGQEIRADPGFKWEHVFERPPGMDFRVQDIAAFERLVRGSAAFAEDSSYEDPYRAVHGSRNSTTFIEVTKRLETASWPGALRIMLPVPATGIINVHLGWDGRVVGRNRWGAAIFDFNSDRMAVGIVRAAKDMGFALSLDDIRIIYVTRAPEPCGIYFEFRDATKIKVFAGQVSGFCSWL